MSKKGATTQVAYKFRQSDQFERILHILQTESLYCAPYDKLNDPSEGHYLLSAKDRKAHDGIAARVRHHKQLLRVCSLCKTLDSTVMWAHYAGGFDGVAIEVEIADAFDVIYLPKLPSIGALSLKTEKQVKALAQKILSYKLKEWKDEKELRVLQSEEFKRVKVKTLIVGPRVCSVIVAALQAICPAHIRIKYARLSLGKICVCDRDPYASNRRLI